VESFKIAFSRFDTMNEGNRQTDGRNCYTALCIPSRSEN